MSARSSRVAATGAALMGLVAPALATPAAHAEAVPARQAPYVPGTSAALPSERVAPAKKIPELRYTIKRGDSLWKIARSHGVSMHTLAAHNGLRLSDIIHPGQVVRIPSPAGTAAPAAPKPTAPKPAKPAAPVPAVKVTHTVVPGDTLSRIAAKHGTSVSALVKANGLTNPNLIFVGQSIVVSGTSSTAAPTKPAPAKPKPAPAKPSNATYVVRSGDTLSGIAAKHGTSVSALVKANRLANPNLIRVGQRLVISSQASTPTQGGQLVPDSFLGRTYPKEVVGAANENKATLNAMQVPSREQMKAKVRATAVSMGVDPSLALAIAYQESGFNHRSVSPANAIGTMQVIPSSGVWASDLVGRKLNLLDPNDNVVAGVAIIRQLLRSADTLDDAIAGYYQGLGSVKRNGMFADTKFYVQRVKGHQQNFR
ncbi:MAG: LysM peptidoglycan-binding domain-containing protein [Bowdeniella nasicola]|nr:LysM peptidoglycan-binding domain-containing protein [Bowdeniella nasicola]